jgi:hypothetical protein
VATLTGFAPASHNRGHLDGAAAPHEFTRESEVYSGTDLWGKVNVRITLRVSGAPLFARPLELKLGTACEQPRSEDDGEGQISARNECSAAWDLPQEPEGSDHKEER